MSFENALYQWQEGQRRLETHQAPERRVLERVVEAIRAELRRRLGGSFTTDELVELYGRGTDWTLAIAVAIEPDAPWAWEARIVADAAFARYLRDALDFGGGRRSAGAVTGS